MNIEPTSRQYIVRQLAKEFRFDGGELATAIAAVAEHIRSSCAILGIAEDGTRLGPSSIIKICRTTHRRLYPMFKDVLSNSDSVSEEISKLDRLGDVVKIDASWAVIGPARRISIDESQALLVGGGPLSTFPTAVRGLVEVAGRSRILVGAIDMPSLNFMPFQRLEDWLELDRDDMHEWANLFINAKLKPERNILIPEDLVLWSHFRWIPLAEFFENNRVYLARRKVSRFGNSSFDYFLTRFRKNGAVQKADAWLPIGNEDARKLQGLILRDVDGSEKLKFSIIRKGVAELVINHPLANSYKKILDLGWQVGDGDAYGKWPKRFEFAQKLIPLLESAFGLIGYDLVEK